LNTKQIQFFNSLKHSFLKINYSMNFSWKMKKIIYLME
jgi:hypothetical protein